MLKKYILYAKLMQLEIENVCV